MVRVMLGKMAQSSVVCQSVCLDLNWIEKLCCITVLTLLMPWMVARVWVLDNLKGCTHLSYMKLDWEPLSHRALQGTYLPYLL